MSKQIKGLLYFYLSSTRYSFIVFWSILLGILAFTLTVSYLFQNREGVMTMSMTGPLYFYFGIYGFILVKTWIPFLIKVGATRKNIFFSLAIYFGGISIIFSLISTAIQSIVTPLAERIGLDIFSFLHLSYFFTDTWYARILIDVTIMIFIFSLLFVIGLLFYKYGIAIAGVVLASIFVIILFGIFQGWLADFVINVFTNANLHLFWQISLVAIAIYGLSWVFLRRITIVSKK